MEYTKGPWTIKNIPSHGLEIYAEVNMGKDENGGVLQPIYNVDIEPHLRVGKDGTASVMIAYESWRQFPSINFQKMQEANAQLIATAPELCEALKEARGVLEVVSSGLTSKPIERALLITSKALAKVEGK